MANKKIISDVIITRHKVTKAYEAPPAPPPAPPPPATKPPPVAKPEFRNIAPKKDKTAILSKLKIPSIAAALIVFALILLAASSVRNAKMVVTITPKSSSLVVNKDMVLAKSSGGAVLYSSAQFTYPLSGIFSSEVANVSGQKAEGTIVIFNKSGADAQILVASTRLATPDGKIYRIPSTIVIPGIHTENGKTIPGSKEIKVIADQPGPDYNIGLTDFTIPGFKGSPKFNTMFARSKTEISGGSLGGAKIITKDAVDKAAASLVSDVNKNLKNIISKKLTSEQLPLPGSEEFAVLNIDTSPKIGEAADTFELKINGEVRAATILNKDIAAALTASGFDKSSFGSVDLRITNPGELAFNLSVYQFGAASFGLNIKGNARIEAALDAENIKNQLVERRITNAEGVLNATPGATRAEVEFRPFWAGSLPRSFLNPAGRVDHIDITILSR